MSSSQLAIAQTYIVWINGNSTASKAKKPSHGSHSISVNGNTLTRIIAVSSHTYVSRTICLESMKAALTYLRYLKTKLP